MKTKILAPESARGIEHFGTPYQTWAHAVENIRIYQYYLEGAENIQHNFSKISTTFYLSDSDFSKF